MALQSLQSTASFTPKLPSLISARAVLHLTPPRRTEPPPLTVARARSGVRIAAVKRGNGAGEGAKRMRKDVDLATLGNLCVDIVLTVPSLPPSPVEERLAYMERLASSPPDKI